MSRLQLLTNPIEIQLTSKSKVSILFHSSPFVYQSNEIFYYLIDLKGKKKFEIDFISVLLSIAAYNLRMFILFYGITHSSTMQTFFFGKARLRFSFHFHSNLIRGQFFKFIFDYNVCIV